MNTSTKTAIVTGAGSGIGLAVAEAFVHNDYSVVLNGRTREKLERAADSLGVPDRLTIVTGDVTRPEAADQIVKTAVGRFGRVDLLVNNAGIF